MPRSAKKTTQTLSSPRAAIPVRALDFVMYNTKDMRRTRAFYQRIFGFKRGHERGKWWSEFATEPLTLCLNGPAPHPRRMGLERRGVGRARGGRCARRHCPVPEAPREDSHRARRDARLLDGVDRRSRGKKNLPPFAQRRLGGVTRKISTARTIPRRG